MSTLSETTINLLLSGLMGILGSFVSVPFHLLISSHFKHEEQAYQHKLDIIAKQRELLLQHKLELERHGKSREFDDMKKRVVSLEEAIRELNNG